MNTNNLTVEIIVNAPIATVWQYWNDPAHITRWAFASHDWEAPSAENDLRPGGRFKTVMAAKDGSARFEFTGTYTNVIPHERIEYTMDDGRRVSIVFTQTSGGVHIAESFEPERENPAEMQRAGWQAILESFKHFTEAI